MAQKVCVKEHIAFVLELKRFLSINLYREVVVENDDDDLALEQQKLQIIWKEFEVWVQFGSNTTSRKARQHSDSTSSESESESSNTD